MANRGLQTLLLCIVTPISTMRTCEKSMYTTRIRLAGSIIPGSKCQNGEKVWSLQVSSSSLPFSSPLLPVGEKKVHSNELRASAHICIREGSPPSHCGGDYLYCLFFRLHPRRICSFQRAWLGRYVLAWLLDSRVSWISSDKSNV